MSGSLYVNPENRVFPEEGFLFHLSWFYCCGSWLYYMNSAVADTCCITYHKKAAMLLVRPLFHQYLLDSTRMLSLLLGLWRVVTLEGHGVVFWSHFPLVSFQNDGVDFCERDALMTH